jgi:hypothetical protein
VNIFESFFDRLFHFAGHYTQKLFYDLPPNVKMTGMAAGDFMGVFPTRTFGHKLTLTWVFSADMPKKELMTSDTFS